MQSDGILFFFAVADTFAIANPRVSLVCLYGSLRIRIAGCMEDCIESVGALPVANKLLVGSS